MKKFITIVCVVGSTLIILDSFNTVHSLILFVLFGIIPGTNLIIAPIDMMAAIATAITVIILRVMLWTRIRSLLFSTPEKPKYTRSTRRTV
jgi:hypothetical protein